MATIKCKKRSCKISEDVNTKENVKKQMENGVLTELSIAEETAPIKILSENINAVSATESGEKQNKQSFESEKAVTGDFSKFAKIRSESEEKIIEECKIFQIRKIMAFLSKAVVRHGLSENEAKTLIKNAYLSGLGEITVSPAYLGGVANAIKRGEDVKICAIVDFPFGESSFKVKFSEIKNSLKAGVDEVLAVVNSASVGKDGAKQFKKQSRKIGKLKGVKKGLAVNGEDMSADDIKRFLRLSEKSGVDYAAFLFGNLSEKELKCKMDEINSARGKTSVKIMANVENVAGVKTLIAMKADGIITPYADVIAKELFKEFNITSVKLA